MRKSFFVMKPQLKILSFQQIKHGYLIRKSVVLCERQFEGMNSFVEGVNNPLLINNCVYRVCL